MSATGLKEFQDEFNNFAEEVNKRYGSLNLPAVEEELADLKKRLEDPAIWQDQQKMRDLQSRIANHERRLNAWLNLKNGIADVAEYIEIALLEDEGSMLGELQQRYEQYRKEYDKLDLESLLNEPDDECNAFLNLHPGAGGTESHDWADMLYRMYTRWADQQGFQVQIVDYQEGEEAGIKNATLHITGPNAFGYLKAENGVHRLVRISPFDSNKRRHTSFVAVHVSPEISDDVDVDINDKDLRVDTYRSSGAGGQHVNKTDSAVRITHEPTGIVVACQNERSQMKNRATAMKMLKARLYELAVEEKQKDIESRSGERKDISWGNQIRSYVFHPYNMVKDLRTSHETGNVQAVMDGDLDPFIDAYLRAKSSDKLNTSAEPEDL